MTRFLARHEVLMPLIRLWSSPDTVDTRSSAIVHALIEKLFFTFLHSLA